MHNGLNMDLKKQLFFFDYLIFLNFISYIYYQLLQYSLFKSLKKADYPFVLQTVLFMCSLICCLNITSKSTDMDMSGTCPYFIGLLPYTRMLWHAKCFTI